MKTPYTPGPWYASNTGSDQGLVCAEKTGETIAVTYDTKNAPLVAVAPELHQALLSALDELEYLSTCKIKSPNGDYIEVSEATIQLCRTARSNSPRVEG